jgi:hypothetical protein
VSKKTYGDIKNIIMNTSMTFAEIGITEKGFSEIKDDIKKIGDNLDCISKLCNQFKL